MMHSMYTGVVPDVDDAKRSMFGRDDVRIFFAARLCSFVREEVFF